MTPKACYAGVGIPASWARCPFGLAADSAPDGCCEGLYNGVFWWGPGTRYGEEVGAGAREGTELKISLAAPAALRRAPREPAGKRLMGIGHRDRSHRSRNGTALLATPAARGQTSLHPGEKHLCTLGTNSFASRGETVLHPAASGCVLLPGTHQVLSHRSTLSRFTFLQPLCCHLPTDPKPPLFLKTHSPPPPSISQVQQGNDFA